MDAEELEPLLNDPASRQVGAQQSRRRTTAPAEITSPIHARLGLGITFWPVFAGG
jgi:hypothetical protein